MSFMRENYGLATVIVIAATPLYLSLYFTPGQNEKIKLYLIVIYLLCANTL